MDIKRLICIISFVQSILNYRITVQEQAYDSHVKILKSTVNSKIKFLLNKPKYTNNDNGYHEFKIYNIKSLYFKIFELPCANTDIIYKIDDKS